VLFYNLFRVKVILIVEDPTVTVKCRTAIKALFLPKSNFIDGSMSTKTGRAVPAKAISTDVSGGKKGNL
jgi:hypothetical protein